MRFSSLFSPLIGLATLASSVSALRMIESTSLHTCMERSNFTATLFNVQAFPDNKTASINMDGVSSLTGNFNLHIEIAAYGYVIVRETINPCDIEDLEGICKMQPGPIPLETNLDLTDDMLKQVPGIAWEMPDLDATVRVTVVSNTDPDRNQACVEARLSNTKTTDQNGVSWATAVIAGLALVVSAVAAGLGHSNTAAHIASYALSLFGYFQAMAIVGFVAVPLPPIVRAWTQNFMWTMGVIEVEFMQTIATWYQKSTGGTPATILNTLTTTSVQVQKRSFIENSSARMARMASEANGLAHLTPFAKRSNNPIDTHTGNYIVTGIDRVAFLSDMEATNVFITGLIFFCLFVIITILGVAAFKGICELLVRTKKMKSDKFLDFRNGWLVVLKGIMFRLVLIGFPQMTILCLWEFTRIDSPAEVVLAVFYFFGMTATLGWAAFKVVMIARRSKQMHKNPAYILYSDPTALNKWGFLYVQFRATAYYYIIPVLVYTIVKAMFIGLGQGNGKAQCIGLFIIEAAMLIAASVMKPWMDKSTNTVNIAICAFNFVNSIFLLIFSDIFGQPAIVTGVVGVVFFIANAVFALVLLILVIVSTVMAFMNKNPDTRYQPMHDDRGSFIKSQTQLTTELDALGATARGDGKGGFKGGLDLDDDNDSWDTESMRQRNAANMPLPPSSHGNPPRSPGLVDSSVPLFPSGGQVNEKSSYGGNNNVYGGSYGAETRHNSDVPLVGGGQPQMRSLSPSPYGAGGGYNRAAAPSPLGQRQPTNASPWQRGAGYE